MVAQIQIADVLFFFLIAHTVLSKLKLVTIKEEKRKKERER